MCFGLIVSTVLGVSASEPIPVDNRTPVRQCLTPNQPLGTPKGIYPGRVVWTHAPGAVRWNMEDKEWYSDSHVNGNDCEWLVERTVLELSGAGTVGAAWDRIFRYFNEEHGRGARGYKPGETITIKVNNNNTSSHSDSDEINASPQLIYALLKSLIEEAGVDPKDIIVAEPSRFITNSIFEKSHSAYPGVRFVDNSGGDGREKAEYEENAMSYSADNGQLSTGIAKVFADATYVINMALLKGHVGQRVTLCGKNWYGAMKLDADWRKNFHDNFNQNYDGTPKYMTFVDFMGHKDLGGKCMLWLIDGLYGCRNVGGAPGPKWSMEPFNGDWPCSLFGSLDPVAIDAVGVDFLTNEFPDMPEADCSDMYLVEAATAGALSDTSYTPSGSGRPLTSLGVAEHWSDPISKRYTTIDLRYVRK